MNKRKLPQAFLIGSLSFWLPIVIAPALLGPDWGGMVTVFLLTFALPVSCCFVLEAFTSTWNQPRSRCAAVMVFGIWVTGPFWINVANTSAPGLGFHMTGVWSYLGLTTATFPFSLIMMATYQGSLFALLFTTAALAVFSATDWSFQPLLNRCVVCRWSGSAP